MRGRRRRRRSCGRARTGRTARGSRRAPCRARRGRTGSRCRADRGQAERDVVDRARPAAGRTPFACGAELEIDLRRARRGRGLPGRSRRGCRRARRSPESWLPADRARLSKRWHLKRRRAVERADAVVGDEAHRADGRAVLVELRVGERPGLGVDDELDVALPVERHLLRAMRPTRAEAERLEHRRERRCRPRSTANSMNAKPVERRRRGRIERARRAQHRSRPRAARAAAGAHRSRAARASSPRDRAASASRRPPCAGSASRGRGR